VQEPVVGMVAGQEHIAVERMLEVDELVAGRFLRG